MNQDAVHKMKRLTELCVRTAKEQILSQGVTAEVQKLLLMKELIKEQMPNENSSRTANKNR